MDTKGLMKRDIPVIALAFSIAFLVPAPFNPGEVHPHLAGIAIGFGFAWLLKFLMDYKKITTEKKDVA